MISLDKLNESFQSAEDLSELRFIKLLSFCYDNSKSEFFTNMEAKFWVKLTDLQSFRTLLIQLNWENKQIAIWMYYDYFNRWLEDLLSLVNDDKKKEAIKANYMSLVRSHMISIFACTYDLSTVFKNVEFVVWYTRESVIALFVN